MFTQMKKNKDARFFINKNLNRSSNASRTSRTDARNFIKFRNVNRQKLYASRRPIQNLHRFINMKNTNQEAAAASKRILLQKSGDIRITSRRNQEPLQQTAAKKVQASSSGIQVTTLNVQKRHLIDDDEEDLEKMTLDDIPEIKKIKSSVRAAVLPVTEDWEPSSSTRVFSRIPSVGNRLQGQYSSMVADSHSNLQGYTVLVTNLHPSVSDEDIVELFTDIGSMRSAKLIQPGSAAIVYSQKNDALQACEIYHNRLLDGQPMQCSLLNTPAMKPALSSRLAGRLSSTVRPSSSSLSHLPIVSPGISNSSRPVKFTVRVP